MDVGINTSHPDLAGNFGGTYDPTGQPLGVDSHGTLCAGAACAITNNGIGVAGIAWGAKFYSLRIGYNNTGDPNNNSFYSLDSWVVGAFNYALSSTYVTVISCSFSMGSHSSSLDSAIINFASHARNNYGGLIFAATGNDNSSNIGYPASNANVFAIAATDQNDVRASFSNYGPKVALAAPGVSIPTTTYNGGYTQFFSGTSAACPVAAACALLVLQLNPGSLTGGIFAALAQNADKVDYANTPYYRSDTYGTRNDSYGYGRININNYILQVYNIAGPNNYCGTTDYTYYFRGLPSYLTVTWSSSNPNMPVDPNTGLLRNIGGSPDETILTATVSNVCTVISKYVVQGGFGREVFMYGFYDLVPGYNGFAGGDNPNYPLRVPNNSSGFFLPVSYGPFINKSIVYAPPVNENINTADWASNSSDITLISIISAPAGWTNFGVSGNNLVVSTSGNASGTLVLQVQVPCGDQFNVTFTVIGV